MKSEVYNRAQLLVDHIKDLQTVILLSNDLREEATPAIRPMSPSVEQLGMDARKRLRDIIDAVDAVPYTKPSISHIPAPASD